MRLASGRGSAAEHRIDASGRAGRRAKQSGGVAKHRGGLSVGATRIIVAEDGGDDARLSVGATRIIVAEDGGDNARPCALLRGEGHRAKPDGRRSVTMRAVIARDHMKMWLPALAVCTDAPTVRNLTTTHTFTHAPGPNTGRRRGDRTQTGTRTSRHHRRITPQRTTSPNISRRSTRPRH